MGQSIKSYQTREGNMEEERFDFFSETRKWDAKRKITVRMRNKGYRYGCQDILEFCERHGLIYFNDEETKEVR